MHELDGGAESRGDPARPEDAPLPLVIAVGADSEQRMRLAAMLDGVGPLLMVSGLDELRRLLEPRCEDHSAPPAVIEQSADVLRIDQERLVASWGDREVALTPLERDLLTQLATEPLQVWTYEALHQAVWGTGHLRSTADVHSLVKRLRRKLAELSTTLTIDAVRGTGFQLTDHQHPTRRTG
ncbi:winged helix-turn-helix domain-containing protein [Kribbella deserti]|uniref:Winged helix-turn-helix domain-containing protein n=1 Tax=Kribbella deserti TaxID=1926257 RepID=A0ABV6QVB2_9ACTN